MARFLGMVKLSPAGAKTLVDGGLCSRRELFERAAAQAGGTLEHMWMTNVGDWDFVLVVDVPAGTAPTGAAATLARTASGQHQAERWMELIEVDDVAGALTSMVG